MDDESVGDPEFSDATIERMVRRLHPEWSLCEATPAAEGTDEVYFLGVETGEGPRECVLKACEFLNPEAFRPEPHLMSLLDRRTSIPVPRMLGAVDDSDDLAAPYFLMERREGEVRENEAGDLPADVIERIAREAGRNLGELNDVGDFDRFGPVRLARDAGDANGGEGSGVGGDRSGITVDSPTATGDASRTLTVGDAGHDSWRVRFEAIAEAHLDDVPDRFADLEPDLRAFVTDRFDALDREFAPVLGDDDYRLGNLLVDAESGATRAILDWGNVHTMEPLYNLVTTEQYLSGWALHDDPRRERVRAALREGYETTNAVERDPDFERRRELYLAVTRLFPLICFSLWYGHFSQAAREQIATKHRRAVRELVE